MSRRSPVETDKPEDNVSQLRPVAAQAAAGAIGDALERAKGAVAPEPAGEPASPPVTPPAPPAPTEPDASFPSPHVIYLSVVKNELDAQVSRFRNALQMLTAKIKGAETAYQDATKVLADETKRKQQELDDARLGEVTRLNTQIGDVQDVIETYEIAIEKAEAIATKQAQIDQAAGEALKPETKNERDE